MKQVHWTPKIFPSLYISFDLGRNRCTYEHAGWHVAFRFVDNSAFAICAYAQMENDLRQEPCEVEDERVEKQVHEAPCPEPVFSRKTQLVEQPVQGVQTDFCVTVLQNQRSLNIEAESEGHFGARF